MKLDRNTNGDGHGKYGLILNRRLAQIDKLYDGGDGDVADLQAVKDAIALLERAGVIDWGTTTDTEFFVMRLRDRFAGPALAAYAGAARAHGEEEYGNEVYYGLAIKASKHPNSKVPD